MALSRYASKAAGLALEHVGEWSDEATTALCAKLAAMGPGAWDDWRSRQRDAVCAFLGATPAARRKFLAEAPEPELLRFAAFQASVEAYQMLTLAARLQECVGGSYRAVAAVAAEAASEIRLSDPGYDPRFLQGYGHPEIWLLALEALFPPSPARQ